MKAYIKILIQLYDKAKKAKVGETIICPSCKTEFKKTHWQQKFCKTKAKTKCKDYYWNNVDEKKRNNTTRISPASLAWLKKQYQFHDGITYVDKRFVEDDYSWDAHKDTFK